MKKKRAGLVVLYLLSVGLLTAAVWPDLKAMLANSFMIVMGFFSVLYFWNKV